jgi:hypothetical protein
MRSSAVLALTDEVCCPDAWHDGQAVHLSLQQQAFQRFQASGWFIVVRTRQASREQVLLH